MLKQQPHGARILPRSHIYIYMCSKKTNPQKLCESKVVSTHPNWNTPRNATFTNGLFSRDPGFIGSSLPGWNANVQPDGRQLQLNRVKAVALVASSSKWQEGIECCREFGKPKGWCFFFSRKVGGLDVERILIIYKIKHIYFIRIHIYILYILYILHNLDLPTPPGGVLECGEDLLCTLKTCCYSLGELKSWGCI